VLKALTRYNESLTNGYYWIHNNTFKRGYNNWAVADNAPPGDETIGIADIYNATIAYNKFDRGDKTLLVGSWELDTCKDVTIHHNFFAGTGQRMPLARNANVHNYNNYFINCGSCYSPRSNSYFFNEANYMDTADNATYFASAETHGAVKSFGEIYINAGDMESITVVEDREAYVENTCKSDWVTDYSRFDTDPTLFYYDAVNKCSDVDLLLPAEEVPEFVKTYAGAGVYVRMDIPQ